MPKQQDNIPQQSLFIGDSTSGIELNDRQLTFAFHSVCNKFNCRLKFGV